MLWRLSVLLPVMLIVLTLSGCGGLLDEKKGGGEVAYALQQTQDGGYILAGARYLDDVRTVALLIKTDDSGEEEWSQAFEINDSALKAYSVRQTQDGGYIITGNLEPGGRSQTGKNAFLIKTDAGGTEEWSQLFGGSDSDYAYSVQQTQDGGFVLAGYTWSYGDGRYDAWLIKTDAGGNEQWSRTYGSSEIDLKAHFIQQTRDGGYILAGASETAGHYTPGAWLLKTDANGNEEWSQTFDKSNRIFANSVQQTQDGGFIVILSGHPYMSGSSDLYLSKTDALGHEEWSQLFEGSTNDYARSVQQTPDGGYILAGGSENPWLLKTDARGEEEWSRVYGGDERDSAFSVQQSLDGGFVLAGYTWPGGGASPNAWLIKTDALGNEEWSQAFGDEYVAGYTVTPYLVLLLALLALLVFNFGYFWALSGDMKIRGEDHRAWIVKFLFLGPLAGTWYQSYRKPKDGEAFGGNKSYHLAKNFIVHWSIYAWLVPVYFLVLGTLIAGPGYVLIGLLAVLMGVGFLFFIIWFALWLAPVIVAVIIMLAKKPQNTVHH